MAITYSVGNEGNVVLPSGVGFNVKTWAANVAYVSTDLTGYMHTGKVRRLGIIDITGSLGGTPWYSAANTQQSPFGTLSSNLPQAQLGGTLLLALAGGTSATNTSATGALMEFGCVFSSVALNSDKNGDNTVTVNFEMNDSNGPTIVWSTGS